MSNELENRAGLQAGPVPVTISEGSVVQIINRTSSNLPVEVTNKVPVTLHGLPPVFVTGAKVKTAKLPGCGKPSLQAAEEASSKPFSVGAMEGEWAQLDGVWMHIPSMNCGWEQG